MKQRFDSWNHRTKREPFVFEILSIQEREILSTHMSHPSYFLATVKLTNSSLSKWPPSSRYSLITSWWNGSLKSSRFPPHSSIKASCQRFSTGLPPSKNQVVISSGLLHFQCTLICFVCTSLNPAFSRFSWISSGVDHCGLVTIGGL